MERFYSLCLQGDIKSAMKYLSSISPKTNEIIKIEKDFINRFFTTDYKEKIPTEDEWVNRVILIYHNYFRSVLISPKSNGNAELILKEELANLLQVSNTLNIEAIEKILMDAFMEKGFYFLGGVSPPYRGPYIWKSMETLHFDVELPSTFQTVTVHMMSDFLLESWISFATCEKKTAGGWAKDAELYCNSKRYKNIQGEEFQISFLKHETQHLFDYVHFPNLKPNDLEYRAKLIELIYSKDHTILGKFLFQAKNDPTFPHSYASYLIIRNLSNILFNEDFQNNLNMWLEKDYKVISSVSLGLFKRSTNELNRKYNT
ncbi:MULTISPECIES: hypothetical protein [Bacillus]|nr:hypothetical protein [Bacillus pseudomycoides]EEM13876.1 hypothetical protein bpmyx0001_52640 [Bacillus pseudomycoides DSM 12442]MED1594541.1 hypothetical protein [Bacillus pseudomycoides]MED4713086.1 hypothetical protein [Bacillus pseudomycoides]OOR49527.1 hypothetical protein BLX05_23485 [Bacillus pseudomycoides]PDY11348.1 hypothetical protein COO16_16415 [Bacillus pseudomycoides]